MLWPEKIRVSIDGGLGCDVDITDDAGGPLPGVVSLAVTYRPYEIATVTIERVDDAGPIVDGDLPVIRRTYLVDIDAAQAVLKARLPAVA